jgi:polyisoprenyl-teichoic acid--peptidoglycan teichoic acid transferase
MRIPGWLMILAGIGSFVMMTALCSFLSYSLTRTAVIDAADRGVPIPSVAELASFVANPPDAVFAFDLEDLPIASPTAFPTVEIPPTPTTGPTEVAMVTPEATDEAPVEPTPTTSGQIPLSEYLAGGGDQQTADTTDETPAEAPVQTVSMAEIPAWQDTDRINILLMGVDQRGDETFEDRFRTDTMIVVQVDPIRRTMGVLSFPRDLWVRIPGFQANKIAFANYLGDGGDLPGGGPGLAKSTIYENFGIRVDYFVQINFDVFLTVVDVLAPEGITINVTEEIFDPDYPDTGRGTIEVRFEPGQQNMNAERLLQYARTRATQGGDYDRTRRQQEVLDALQQQLLRVDNVPSLISRVPQVYNELADSYRTDLSVDQIMALARLVAETPNENITYGSINALHVTPARSEDGLDILIPNNIAINNVIAQTFDPQPDLSEADLAARALEEEADIVVLNNTSIAGLAGRTQEFLTSRGVSVANIGNVPEVDESINTIILDYTNNTFTARWLAALLGLPQSAIRTGAGSDIQSNADVAVVVGTDIQSLLGGE